MDFHLAFVIAELHNGHAMVRTAASAYASGDYTAGDNARETALEAHSAAVRSMDYISEADHANLQSRIDLLRIAIDGLQRRQAFTARSGRTQ